MENKIGILGGTFDPIHNGHLTIAREAMKEYGLSKIFLIPTGISYMKSQVTDSYFRYEMTKLAAKEEKNFVASDVEILREGNTYTCDTIEYFKQMYAKEQLYFIVGSDSLFSMEKWRNCKYIFENCIILCATRVNDDTKENTHAKEEAKAKELEALYDAKISFVHCEIMEVSSTQIREYRSTHTKDFPDSLELPYSVADYIYRHDLYDQKTQALRRQLKEQIKPKRYIHTMGVVDTATKLALKWGCNLEEARLAALLHDCAKYINEKDKMALCAKYKLPVSDIEKNNPELLHAKAGALLAYEDYGIQNRNILSAIFYHTTAKPSMSILEQVLFIADYIEPGRTHSENLDYYRSLAMEDINKVTAYILKDTLEYLKVRQKKKNLIVDPMTQQSYDFYIKYI